MRPIIDIRSGPYGGFGSVDIRRIRRQSAVSTIPAYLGKTSTSASAFGSRFSFLGCGSGLWLALVVFP